MDKPRFVSYCRKSVGSTVALLYQMGFTWPEIEDALDLRPSGGNTAWRYVNKGKKPKDYVKPDPALKAVLAEADK